MDELAKAVEQMAIENELLRHENGHLKSTLIDQRKRPKKTQTLALDNQYRLLASISGDCFVALMRTEPNRCL
jgi:regulator of replication initiation timing